MTHGVEHVGPAPESPTPLSITQAPSAEALREALRQVNITVPGRTKGRKSRHTETWTICRLLSTLAAGDALSFPLSIVHCDKPDFLIDEAGTSIGVEVTEAISEQFAKYCALAEREFPDAYIEPHLFPWGAPERSHEEMRQLLRQGKIHGGWVGERPEREWALFIQDHIGRKLEKLARDDFAKFDRNWLSIYDNLPLSNVRLDAAIGFLWPYLQAACWSRQPSFDMICVERGPVIAAITPTGWRPFIVEDPRP